MRVSRRRRGSSSRRNLAFLTISAAAALQLLRGTTASGKLERERVRFPPPEAAAPAAAGAYPGLRGRPLVRGSARGLVVDGELSSNPHLEFADMEYTDDQQQQQQQDHPDKGDDENENGGGEEETDQPRRSTSDEEEEEEWHLAPVEEPPSIANIDPNSIDRCSALRPADFELGEVCGAPLSAPCFDRGRFGDGLSIYVYDQEVRERARFCWREFFTVLFSLPCPANGCSLKLSETNDVVEICLLLRRSRRGSQRGVYRMSRHDVRVLCAAKLLASTKSSTLCFSSTVATTASHHKRDRAHCTQKKIRGGSVVLRRSSRII